MIFFGSARLGSACQRRWLAAAPVSAGTRDSIVAAAALTLGPDELELIKTIAPLLGSSPRRAKRFLNVYRVVKARVLIDPGLQGRLTDRTTTHLMLLTAMATGLPTTVPTAIHGADPGVTVTDWLEEDIAPRSTASEAHRLALFLGATTDGATTDGATTDMDGVTMGDLHTWLPIVRRYAWPTILGPEPDAPFTDVERS
ncbi:MULTISPECIES: hypothetical protein [unclassified Streptomyces]|uniref:hypothetical protein n=1 Tax=unclassified Streptomyces TaxID=2593676 RepID=UPI002E80A8AD|nr:hypothetical protein [Streptomyces sp. NBC_00589]WTI39544.1 hypothetical protein OIC96_33555 [Streptomyces sp. NBC_00775]WUB26777.1 hypothetical protein OHA51_16175 [Streptomyces sp. NBC_00589]